MQLNPYLNFDGQCAEAFKFYEQVFDGKIITMMTHGEMPMGQTGEEWKDAIMHASLQIGNQMLLGSDAPRSSEYYHKPEGFAVSITLNDLEKAERIYNALSEGGTVQMPFQETFWAQGFAMFTDRFDIPWMLNCEKTA